MPKIYIFDLVWDSSIYIQIWGIKARGNNLSEEEEDRKVKEREKSSKQLFSPLLSSLGFLTRRWRTNDEHLTNCASIVNKAHQAMARTTYYIYRQRKIKATFLAHSFILLLSSRFTFCFRTFFTCLVTYKTLTLTFICSVFFVLFCLSLLIFMYIC